MSQPVEQRVPDLGEFHDVEVIEVLVKPGDRIEPESPLITLETDKATMDVPATVAGVVKEVRVKKGDRVSKDSLIALVSVGADDTVKIPGLRKTAMLGSPSPSPSQPPTAGQRRNPILQPANRPRTFRRSSWSSARDPAATRRRFARPTSGFP